jgi:hypothetical protein
MVQWFIIGIAAVGGYLAWQKLSTREPKTDNPDNSTVDIGVGTGVTPGTVGEDIAGGEKDFAESAYGGVAQGFAVGGTAGGVISVFIATILKVFKAPPKPPNVERWGIPYRPEWTIWDDVQETATFFVPGPGFQGIEPVEITFHYSKLLELFNGVDIDTIKDSGVVSWRPADGLDPINLLLYSDNVAGSWLRLWEERHFASRGDYSIPGGGGQTIVPKEIRWIDFYKSDPRKYTNEQDASRAILQARRMVYFSTIDSLWRQELVKFWWYAGWHRAGMSAEGKAYVTDRPLEESQNSEDVWNLGISFCYALANACKIYLMPYGSIEGVEIKGDVKKPGSESVNDVKTNLNRDMVDQRFGGTLGTKYAIPLLGHGNAPGDGEGFTAIYGSELQSYKSQKSHVGFPHLWSIDNA